MTSKSLIVHSRRPKFRQDRAQGISGDYQRSLEGLLPKEKSKVFQNPFQSTAEFRKLWRGFCKLSKIMETSHQMQSSYFIRKADSGLCSSLNARLTQACISASTRSSLEARISASTRGSLKPASQHQRVARSRPASQLQRKARAKPVSVLTQSSLEARVSTSTQSSIKTASQFKCGCQPHLRLHMNASLEPRISTAGQPASQL